LLKAGLATGSRCPPGPSIAPPRCGAKKQDRPSGGHRPRKHLVFAIQRYAAEQQYYVYLSSQVATDSWQPYVKNYAPNQSMDYGNRAAALWLDR
jgi:hypothetical protein